MDTHFRWMEENGIDGAGVKPGFLDVFLHLDIIQPWAVGAFANETDAESHAVNLHEADKQFAAAHGIGYQKVIFPGFAWSNWNGGARNAIPRRAGRFFWTQAYLAKRANIPVFIAMFDEYDEGTAIAKAAEDASMIPTDQYFLTLDADGQSLSSDFYLRLAGAATQMLKGQAPLSRTVPIPNRVTAQPPQPPPPPPPATGDVPPQTAMANTTVQRYSAGQADVIVARLYRAVLGREVDPSGAGAYGPLVRDGRLPAVVNALVGSGEFDQHRAGLSTDEWANTLYQALLDRGADGGGHAVTVDAIRQAHAANRIADMVLSPEYASKN